MQKALIFTFTLMGMSLPGIILDSHAESAETASQKQLPDDPLSQKAKDAYNAGRYNEAARLLKRLAIRWPSNGPVYQALARAYSWASEPANAIIAYRHAMTLNLEKSEQDKTAQA